MLGRVQEQLRLETDLHSALTRQEFFVVYQPIMDLATERLRGFEALLRWRHPERGLIPPGCSFPWLKKPGSSSRSGVGYSSRRSASCGAGTISAQNWDQMISVNLSLRQIYNPQLEAELATVTKETGLDPALLHSCTLGLPRTSSWNTPCK